MAEGSTESVHGLQKWAVLDDGWERILSSVSLYEIARHAYQQAEYDEAIIALEESLALRLFAYVDQRTLDRWQQGLVLPGSLFRRQKMDIANILVLRSDCLVQLAQEQKDVDDLTEAMELLQLATALLKAGGELVPDSVNALRRRAQKVAAVAVDLLPRLKTSHISEVLENYGLSCQGCTEKSDYLVRLVPLLRLPVKVVGRGSGGKVEALEDPFTTHVAVLLRKPTEHVAQYMQRVFFRLLTMVPMDYLAELNVACRKHDPKGRCISYLPSWVTAQAITVDKRTGAAHVSAPGACAGEGDVGGLAGALPGVDDAVESEGDQSPHRQARSTARCPEGQCSKRGVPDAKRGTSSNSSPAPYEPHNRAGVQQCGFLHIRAIPPGVELPTQGGSLTPEQQKALQRKAVEGMQAGGKAPFQGVYYYYYSDMPALVDRIVNTFDREESDFLFAQLDALSAAQRLEACSRRPVAVIAGCTEQSLLEGRAPSGCSVVVPNFGSCASTPLKPPRRRMPLPNAPPGLGLPPPRGSYIPKYRKKAAEVHWGKLNSDAVDVDLNGSGGEGPEVWKPLPHFGSSDREISDRQLQEQLAKLSRDHGHRDRDDPLIPLTLAGCVMASFGLYLASKHRRSIWGFMGVKPKGSGVSLTSQPGAVAEKPGSVNESQLKRQAAAALRDAMTSGDASKLDTAVQEASALDLDASLLQRARVLLSQRKKKEREKAAQAAARARAMKKEQTKRQKAQERAKARGADSADSESASQAGPAATGAFEGTSSSKRSWSWLGKLFSWVFCGVNAHSAKGEEEDEEVVDSEQQCHHAGSKQTGLSGGHSSLNGSNTGLNGFQLSRSSSPDLHADSAKDSSTFMALHVQRADSATSYQAPSLTDQHSYDGCSDSSDGWQEATPASKRKAKQQTQQQQQQHVLSQPIKCISPSPLRRPSDTAPVLADSVNAATGKGSRTRARQQHKGSMAAGVDMTPTKASACNTQPGQPAYNNIKAHGHHPDKAPSGADYGSSSWLGWLHSSNPQKLPAGGPPPPPPKSPHKKTLYPSPPPPPARPPKAAAAQPGDYPFSPGSTASTATPTATVSPMKQHGNLHQSPIHSNAHPTPPPPPPSSQAHHHATPTKQRLNPKAAPYHPTSAPTYPCDVHYPAQHVAKPLPHPHPHAGVVRPLEGYLAHLAQQPHYLDVSSFTGIAPFDANLHGMSAAQLYAAGHQPHQHVLPTFLSLPEDLNLHMATPSGPISPSSLASPPSASDPHGNYPHAARGGGLQSLGTPRVSPSHGLIGRSISQGLPESLPFDASPNFSLFGTPTQVSMPQLPDVLVPGHSPTCSPDEVFNNYHSYMPAGLQAEPATVLRRSHPGTSTMSSHHHPVSAAMHSSSPYCASAPQAATQFDVFGSGKSVWGPPASEATAGDATATTLWMAGSATAPSMYGYSLGGVLDLEQEVAAARTSAVVAEQVLGSSPSMATAEAEMNKLAHDIMKTLVD
eukprot:jgi/Chrzof1/1676/Cz10g16240.t1